jgi:hypothetical protein
MLIVKHSHKQYQNFVHDFFTHHFISTGQHITLFTRAPLILKLCPADLTGIVVLLKSRYAKSNRGTPPKDAVAMLRSLILMTFTGETSISNWVDILRSVTCLLFYFQSRRYSCRPHSWHWYFL